MPTQAAALDTVPRDQIGAGTTLYNATRQAGSAIGVAIAATVIAGVGVGLAPAADPTPFRWALVACAVCNVLGVLLALTVNDDDAAPSRGLPAPADPVSGGPSGKVSVLGTVRRT